MISKDSNYINTKLKELKQSVLSKQNQFEGGSNINKYKLSPSKTSVYNHQPNYIKSNPISHTEYFKNQNPEVRKTYQNNNILKFGTNTSEKPRFENNYSNRINTDYQFNKEPRVLHAQEPKSPFKTNYLNNTKYDLNKNSYLNKYEQSPYKKHNIRVKSSNYERNSYGNDFEEPEILRNVMEKSFQEGKHDKNLARDLNERFLDESKNNEQLISDIDMLNRKLDSERKNLAQMDGMCKEELMINKEKENEVLSNLEKLEINNQEIEQNLEKENNRNFEQKTDFDKIERENVMLKNELKKIMELTGEKILEIENNINSLGRMKEFEKDNYEMEKEKFTSSSEFVIEQMRAQFMERSHQIEENNQKTKIEKDKIQSELRVLAEELRAFNTNADHKIKNIMNTIINEEENKQKGEIRELEDKIRVEEDQIKQVLKENQEKIQYIQNSERDINARVIGKRNENMRLKEELSVLEQQYNKMLLQLNNVEKENEKKNFMILRLEEEKESIQDKSNRLSESYNKELEILEEQQLEDVKEVEDAYNRLLSNEKEMINEIRDKNNEIIDLQKRQSDIIEQYQSKLNQTLSNFDNNVKKESNYGGF